MPKPNGANLCLEAALRVHVDLMALVVPVLFKFIPLRTVLWLVTPPAWLRPYARLRTARIAAEIRRALRRPRVVVRRDCLRRGLLLLHFMRLAGRPATLRIAALATPPGRTGMRAHCWVMLDGRPYGREPEGPSALVLHHPQAGPAREDSV